MIPKLGDGPSKTVASEGGAMRLELTLRVASRCGAEWEATHFELLMAINHDDSPIIMAIDY